MALWTVDYEIGHEMMLSHENNHTTVTCRVRVLFSIIFLGHGNRTQRRKKNVALVPRLWKPTNPYRVYHS